MAITDKVDVQPRLPIPPHTNRQTFQERAEEIGLEVSRGRRLDFSNRPLVKKRRRILTLLRRIAGRP